MKAIERLLGRPAPGLGLLLLLSVSCSTVRETDLLSKGEQRREGPQLVGVPMEQKMLVRTRDGVKLVDDYSARAAQAQVARNVEKQREAVRHQAEAYKAENLLPQ